MRASFGERVERGRALRESVPRESHAALGARGFGSRPDCGRRGGCNGPRSRARPHPARAHGGLSVRVPARYRRRDGSRPRDDARRPACCVQACGDAHILNFGEFATPERNVIFDVNDFDETHPAPFEWDVKRLAASLEIAMRGNGGAAAGSARRAIRRAVGAYRVAHGGVRAADGARSLVRADRDRRGGLVLPAAAPARSCAATSRAPGARRTCAPTAS